MEVMRCMGFGEIWRGWIMSCLKSVMVSVLVNGSLTREFSLGKGVRQGDPLSPFLFIIDAEGLNILAKSAVDKNLFNGIEVGRDKVLISHLQYADDTIFFGNWNRNNALNLINILKCFELSSGLKANFHKSFIYGVGVPFEDVENMAFRMGCKAGKLPFMYLGLPIGTKMSNVTAWQPVIDKFKIRLSDWKMRLMFFGGRLVLVKSVLSILPLYYFSLFRAPSSVTKLLESMRRVFFWGGDFSGNKMSWVKWEKVISPYGAGGLNIGSLKSKNLALLRKWWWRFKTETDSLWVKVIHSLYGTNGSLVVNVENPQHTSLGVWDNIVRVGKHIEDLEVQFNDSFVKVIGDGGSVSFWDDCWCGSNKFREIFPRLYRLESNKSVSVKARLDPSSSINVSAPQVPSSNAHQAPSAHQVYSNVVVFQSHTDLVHMNATARSLSSISSLDHRQTAVNALVSLGVADHITWECSGHYKETHWLTLNEFNDLKQLLRDVNLVRDKKDSWKWSLASNGLITVKKLSSIIDARILGISNNNGEATCRNGLVPKKVELFVWHSLLNRLPVRLELDNRGIDLHSVRCPICDDGLESDDHSIISCRLAQDIWCRVFKWWDRGVFTGLSLAELLRDSANVGLIWQGVTWGYFISYLEEPQQYGLPK
ncbi:uncharacterized protein [Rutidosis leptorrhynchoides]|uniref:uncharacterized protein n=1 Tax=Rutidosis leptorrhynchoides TaxID=125765 RepID=UPI003A991A8B